MEHTNSLNLVNNFIASNDHSTCLALSSSHLINYMSYYYTVHFYIFCLIVPKLMLWYNIK